MFASNALLMIGAGIAATGRLAEEESMKVVQINLPAPSGSPTSRLAMPASSSGGTAAQSLNGFQLEYDEVEADHPGTVPLALPDVFSFLDRVIGP